MLDIESPIYTQQTQKIPDINDVVSTIFSTIYHDEDLLTEMTKIWEYMSTQDCRIISNVQSVEFEHRFFEGLSFVRINEIDGKPIVCYLMYQGLYYIWFHDNVKFETFIMTNISTYHGIYQSQNNYYYQQITYYDIVTHDDKILFRHLFDRTINIGNYTHVITKDHHLVYKTGKLTVKEMKKVIYSKFENMVLVYEHDCLNHDIKVHTVNDLGIEACLDFVISDMDSIYPSLKSVERRNDKLFMTEDLRIQHQVRSSEPNGSTTMIYYKKIPLSIRIDGSSQTECAEDNEQEWITSCTTKNYKIFWKYRLIGQCRYIDYFENDARQPYGILRKTFYIEGDIEQNTGFEEHHDPGRHQNTSFHDDDYNKIKNLVDGKNQDFINDYQTIMSGQYDRTANRFVKKPYFLICESFDIINITSPVDGLGYSKEACESTVSETTNVVPEKNIKIDHQKGELIIGNDDASLTKVDVATQKVSQILTGYKCGAIGEGTTERNVIMVLELFEASRVVSSATKNRTDRCIVRKILDVNKNEYNRANGSIIKQYEYILNKEIVVTDFTFNNSVCTNGIHFCHSIDELVKHGWLDRSFADFVI